MSEISFKSTYKIPVTQWGINNTKKNTIKIINKLLQWNHHREKR